MKVTSLLLIILLAASGCTSSQAIRNPAVDGINIEQARETKQVDKQVRWGGLIVSVENKSDQSIIEIVEKPLTRYGVPKITNKTGGRFLATSEQFLEPEDLKAGRYITVSGKLSGYQAGQIGDYQYEYPQVTIAEYKVWPVNNYRPYRRYNSFYYHDPYWGFYPYYFRHHRYHHHYW